jgi:hypothetical protein
MIARYKRPNPKRAKPRAVHSERTAHLNGGHNRVRLYGPAREKRRAEIFARAGGRCEETFHEIVPSIGGDLNGEWMLVRCPNRATQWSHKKHSANKCDCLDPKCSIASCDGCHERRHHPKACPKKEKVA